MRTNRSRNRVGRRVAAVGATVLAAMVLAVGALSAIGQPPVYQRTSSAAGGAYWGGYAGNSSQAAPPVSSGSFQRPYPYHLDYYRMRYGGSYAPYFGNLYGPPDVVLAAPYYGGYGYGGYGYGGYGPYAGGNGSPQNAYPQYAYPPPGSFGGCESEAAAVGPPIGYPAGPALDADELPPSVP